MVAAASAGSGKISRKHQPFALLLRYSYNDASQQACSLRISVAFRPRRPGEDGPFIMAACALMTDGLQSVNRLFEPVSLVWQVANTPFAVYAALLFSLAGAYLGLWWIAPDYRVFRSMGIYLLLCAVQMVWIYEGGLASNWALISLTAPLLVMIAGEAMRVPNRRWTLLIWPFCVAVFILGWIHGLHGLRSLPVDVSDVLVFFLIVQGYRRGKGRDRQVAVALGLFLVVRWTLSANFTALTHAPGFMDLGGWRWALTPAAIVVLGAATLVIFVRDLIEDRRAKQRLAAELEAARSVQQVLIPEEIPGIPGFTIQCVYKPAGQVGGDFFQILPIKSANAGGGVLVVIGDVSGKGMPAAMTVSLLVGTIRTLAHYTQNPSEVLSAMNQRMLTRSGGGFTTCLVLRADADGKLTIANAGHIAPYIAGKELPLENGLPLGLSAETTYAESVFELAPGQQLTLLTDGVIEARDKAGALYGFERAAVLSIQPAEAIATAAQAFGQDDDITALTLVRIA